MRIFILCILLAAVPVQGDPTERAELKKWRKQRSTNLKKPYGWLSLAGLIWLKDGEQAFGKDKKNAITLPVQCRWCGVLEVAGKKVWITPAKDVRIWAGKRALGGKTPVRVDKDEFFIGETKFMVLTRSRGLMVRVWDPHHPVRKNFHGLKWYYPSKKFRVQAKFTRAKSGRKIKIADIVGGKEDWDVAGDLEFKFEGQRHKLLALESDNGLFVLFKDKTNGKDTYPAGRFIWMDGIPKSGAEITLDFNRAYNPPCAVTKYATCPLPPRENRLKLRVEAGEKYAGKH